jgi:hypothetical protein
MFRSWRSKAVGIAWAIITSGCIVAEPAPYEPPSRTPPVLDLWRAIPLVGSTIPVDLAGDPEADDPTLLEFSVPVRSEDHNEWLHYILYIDYKLPGATKAGVDDRFPPSTFDDETRVINFPWRVERISRGCHQLSLVVVHDSSWHDRRDEPDSILSVGDIGLATWWINVDPPPGEKYTLRNCPSIGQEVEP